MLGIAIGSVWIFHGIYSKVLKGIPRHEAIVERVLGPKLARRATIMVGLLETGLGLWAVSGVARVECAAVQTFAIVGMNTLEIWLARDLLLSPLGMLALNTGFLVLIWSWALQG